MIGITLTIITAGMCINRGGRSLGSDFIGILSLLTLMGLLLCVPFLCLSVMPILIISVTVEPFVDLVVLGVSYILCVTLIGASYIISE